MPCSPQDKEADADALDETNDELLLEEVGDGVEVLESAGAEVETAYVLPGLLLATTEDGELADDEMFELKMVDAFELRDVNPARAELEAVELEAGEEWLYGPTETIELDSVLEVEVRTPEAELEPVELGAGEENVYGPKLYGLAAVIVLLLGADDKPYAVPGELELNEVITPEAPLVT